MNFIDNFFRPDILETYWPMILRAMGTTLQLASVIVVTGLIGGLLLAVIRLFQVRVINFFIKILVDMFRALPPLMVIITLYFALPLINITITGFAAVWIALGFKLAAFAEEIFYASILSVRRGQVEAARASGLTFLQTLSYIVLPQALRISIPPITNRTIGITKGTALGSVVAVPEILAVATDVQAIVYNTTPLTMAAIAYFIIFFPLVTFSRWIETKYAWKV